MKKFLVAFFCLFPSPIAILFLKLIGQNVSWSSKIGCSLVLCPNIELSKNTRIGHFNLIKINRIQFNDSAYIGHLNIIKGPFDLDFDKEGAIGNSNIISRAKIGVTYGHAVLKMGELAKITARHTIDLTRNITIEKFSTIAGSGSQVWTHGYIHAREGRGRIRVDGEIHIKNNVYIGSNCVINAGITIQEAITVGSNSTISKDLVNPGMYVGQGLRFIEKDLEEVKVKLRKVNIKNLVEQVYEK